MFLSASSTFSPSSSSSSSSFSSSSPSSSSSSYFLPPLWSADFTLWPEQSFMTYASWWYHAPTRSNQQPEARGPKATEMWDMWPKGTELGEAENKKWTLSPLVGPATSCFFTLILYGILLLARTLGGWGHHRKIVVLVVVSPPWADIMRSMLNGSSIVIGARCFDNGTPCYSLWKIQTSTSGVEVRVVSKEAERYYCHHNHHFLPTPTWWPNATS